MIAPDVTVYTSYPQEIPGEPRTIGASLKYRF